MTLQEELQWRGFINQSTFTDLADLNTPRTFYIGVDPSADSMTIGNLAAMMLARHFISYGYKAILLVGGATGMIGDPDGKKQERDLRNRQVVEQNAAALAAQFATIFNDEPFEIVNNNDWFQSIGFVDFLHQVGKHVSMTQLLDRDFVQQRIGEGGSGISYAEFSYSLMQGYDFLHLYRTKGATLQLCGADQWGNSVTGVSLIRKLADGEAHVFSTPLIINKQTGVKFGKSEGGAVWLDGTKTSPYKFYQFWLNIDDEMAKDLIKIYTFLSQDVIAELTAQHEAEPASRLLQKTLAREITTIIHGQERAEAVVQASHILFTKGEFTLTDDVRQVLAGELPVVPVGTRVVEALVQAGVAGSNGQARRLLADGAVSVSGRKLAEDETLATPSLLKKGKNSFVLVQ
ncbi:tyrosine--tRNA ligase [Candidatus Saccharibacteria bacterium]|nr:tyrosine--tRNA ligase [Candidatus Saccharibacteria bacterium]